MVMVEAWAQQAAVASRALEETRAELTAKIMELQRENQFLKEAQRKMQYDPFNPEIEENEMDEEVCRPEMKQPKQKTLVVMPMKIPHPMEEVAHSEHHTPRNNEVKRDDLED